MPHILRVFFTVVVITWHSCLICQTLATNNDKLIRYIYWSLRYYTTNLNSRCLWIQVITLSHLEICPWRDLSTCPKHVKHVLFHSLLWRKTLNSSLFALDPIFVTIQKGEKLWETSEMFWAKGGIMLLFLPLSFQFTPVLFWPLLNTCTSMEKALMFRSGRGYAKRSLMSWVVVILFSIFFFFFWKRKFDFSFFFWKRRPSQFNI